MSRLLDPVTGQPIISGPILYDNNGKPSIDIANRILFGLNGTSVNGSWGGNNNGTFVAATFLATQSNVGFQVNGTGGADNSQTNIGSRSLSVNGADGNSSFVVDLSEGDNSNNIALNGVNGNQTCFEVNGNGQLTLGDDDANTSLQIDLSQITGNKGQSWSNSTGTIMVLVSAPATSTTIGAVGQIAFDTTHIYIYTGNGTSHSWIRSVATTF